jgi:hypothetical protein
MNALEIIVLLVLLALEVGLVWAASGISDSPPLSVPKLIGVGLGLGVVCLGFVVFISWWLGLFSNTATNWSLQLTLAMGLTLVLWWLLPTLVYPPVLPVTLRRGALISGVQILLRLFAWALLAGVIFVVLAILQIVRKPVP